MKLGRRFKSALLASAAALYATGIAVQLLASRFQVDRGFGPEPRVSRMWILRGHGIVGLAFLILFGALWSAHIDPGLRQNKKRRSGLALLGAFAVLLLTVPFLFYAAADATRAWACAIHTWLGAILLAPFLIHWRAKRY